MIQHQEAVYDDCKELPAAVVPLSTPFELNKQDDASSSILLSEKPWAILALLVFPFRPLSVVILTSTMHQISYIPDHRHFGPTTPLEAETERDIADTQKQSFSYSSLPPLEENALLGDDGNSPPPPISFSKVQRFSADGQLSKQHGPSPVSYTTSTTLIHIPRQAVVSPTTAGQHDCRSQLISVWGRYRGQFAERIAAIYWLWK
jgi:hypothetical protein